MWITLTYILLQSLGIQHDIHISKTDINYISDANELQMSIHIYLDDMEESITSTHGFNLKQFTPHESPLSDSLCFVYLKDHIEVKIDDLELTPMYIGRESSEDFLAGWYYISYQIPQETTTLECSNNILMELYDDQRNIISAKRNNKKKLAFELLDSDKTNFTLEL